MIRAVLVDDSALASARLRQQVESSGDIEVVGIGSNGAEGLALVQALKPDILVTDLMMPVMDGHGLIESVMNDCPLPILVVSSVLDDGRTNLRSLELGALDVLPKPAADAGELVRKIRQLAGVKVFRRRPRRTEEGPPPPAGSASGRHQLVVIGASAGGPPVLATVLGQLPAEFPTPVVVVQHIAAAFLADMVQWLDSSCALRLAVARMGDRLEPGRVLFAPGDHHLEVQPGGRLTLPLGPPEDGHCPSVNVTMRSAARAFGQRCVGVLLTGMGSDGADGMAAIRRAGGVTLAQNEETSAVWGMPRQAAQRGAVQHLLSPVAIARMLIALEMKRQ